MICVQREIGSNIARLRRRAGLTQQQLADQLTQSTGRAISMHMVSAWERGLRDIPLAITPAICRAIHCSSFDLYPHSDTVPDADLRLMAAIRAMGDAEKDDLIYLLTEWDGDRKALLKLDVLHAVQSPELRYVPDKQIIDSYEAAVRRGDPGIDRRIKTDLAYVKRAFSHLLDRG